MARVVVTTDLGPEATGFLFLVGRPYLYAYNLPMTFQAYIDNIETKTGKTPADFIKLAGEKGLLEPGVKAMQIVKWLADDYGLGRGHAMAIVLILKPHRK